VRIFELLWPEPGCHASRFFASAAKLLAYLCSEKMDAVDQAIAFALGLDAIPCK
jgi:hypothetical protein